MENWSLKILKKEGWGNRDGEINGIERGEEGGRSGDLKY